MDVNINRKKADVCFFNSLSQAKNLVKFRIALHVSETIIMGIMIPIDVLVIATYDDEILSFFCMALVVSLFGFLGNLGHILYLKSIPNALRLAMELNHTVEDEPIDENNKQNWVSQEIYNSQTSITVQQATPEMKKLVQNQLLAMIRVLSLSWDPCNRFIINLTGGASFVLFIYGIIILSTQQVNASQYVVIVIYVVFQFAVHFQFFVCLIFMALIPLFCIFFCIYVCFFQRQKKAKLPQPTPATIQILNQADGADCSICFQPMILQEPVIILPCSTKHVYHDKCIISWTTLKPTCPICRHDLSQD